MEKFKNKAPSMKLVMLYRVVAVLLLLAVGTSMLATAPLAKYATSTSMSSSARVAKFKVAASGAENPSYTLNSTNKSATYNFTVTCDSEVVARYDIIVTLPNALTGVSLSLDDNSPTSVDGTTYKFSGGTFAAGSSQTKNHALTFKMEDGATDVVCSNISVDAVVTQTN